MNHLELFLSLSSLSFQIVLCGVVFARGAHKILPLFAAYACISLACSLVFVLTYMLFGFYSLPSYLAYWYGAYAYAVAEILAIAELCRYGLRKYRGIWALVWRLLTVLSVVLIVHAAADAQGQPRRLAISGSAFLRDIAFSSITILTVLLLIRSYYGLALTPLQRLVATGMCFTCAVDVIGYTVLRSFLAGYLYPLFQVSQKALWPALASYDRRLDDIWNTVHLVCFMIAMGIWCYALRKPLPELNESPELLPAEVYRSLSPAINMRLATLNNRLLELLKP